MFDDRPAFYWAALAMLLFFGALLVPTEWTQAVGSLLDPKANPETTAFTPDVADLDRALRRNEDVEVSPKTLDTLLPYLQARRLSTLGPMTETEVEQAVDIFKEFHTQTDRDMKPGSRRALRDHFIDRLLETFPRLADTTSPDEIRHTLDSLNRQLPHTHPRPNSNPTND